MYKCKNLQDDDGFIEFKYNITFDCSKIKQKNQHYRKNMQSFILMFLFSI